MATRLLTKSEIQAAQNADRKREIDEGVKLARKVDTLRKTSADEETRLKAYRDFALNETIEQIAERTRRRDELAKEVEMLEIRRLEALPPTVKEMEELRRADKELKATFKAFMTREKETVSREKTLQKRQEQARIEDERLAEVRASSIELLKKADEARKTAEKAQQESEKTAHETRIVYEQTLNDLAIRENAASAREKNLVLFEEKNMREETRLRIWALKIQDQYETLLRTQKS